MAAVLRSARRISALLVVLGTVAALPGTPVWASAGQTLTLAWGGDVTPGSSYGHPPDHGRTMLAAVRDQLLGADIATLNLEGTFGSGGIGKCAGRASSTCFAFQAPAANAIALADAGIDVVNVANNHANDFGPSGAAQTARALQAVGVRFTGRPGQITYVDLPRARVAFVGFSAYPWTAPIRDLGAVRALVQRAARTAQVVVVFLHAGAEGESKVHTPNHEEQAFGELRGNPRAFAHTAVRAGADLVLGSGPHVLRGIELYRRRLIAYSLGNLAGYRNFSLRGRSALSALLHVRLDPRGAFAAGRLISLRLTGPGLPVVDGAAAAATLVTSVSRADFGAGAMRVGPGGVLRSRDAV